MVLQWGHVDLQEYANGSFVSNNNICTIIFFNTYYHKQINKISIAAFNETFKQSLDPVYAHMPIRNVRELRTFNPKLRTSPEAKSIAMSSTSQETRMYTYKFMAPEVAVPTNVGATSCHNFGDSQLSMEDWCFVVFYSGFYPHYS